MQTPPAHAEMKCEVDVVVQQVAGDVDLLKEVFDIASGQTSLAKFEEVLTRLGRSFVQIKDAVQSFKECGAVVAPPPVDAGAKVL